MPSQKFDELSPSPETAKCIINDAERALKRSLSMGEKCDLLMDRTGVPSSAEAREIVLFADRLTEPQVTVTTRRGDGAIVQTRNVPAFSVLEAEFGGDDEHLWTRLWAQKPDGHEVLLTETPFPHGTLEIEAAAE